MNTILLTHDGRATRQGEPLAGGVLSWLRLAVELGRGYTLRSFFALVERHREFMELSEFLPPLAERVAAAPGAGCAVDGIEALVLARTVEMVGFPGRPRMEIYTSLMARPAPGGETVPELRHFQVEDLLDMPLALGPLRHVVLGDEVDVFEFETVYTLFEFVEGVSWELSFHGAPGQCGIGGG